MSQLLDQKMLNVFEEIRYQDRRQGDQKEGPEPLPVEPVRQKQERTPCQLRSRSLVKLKALIYADIALADVFRNITLIPSLHRSSNPINVH